MPTHRVHSAGVSTSHCRHAISTSTSSTLPGRRHWPCAAQRSSRSQSPGAQLRTLTRRHSVWNACAHAHALGRHVPSLGGCLWRYIRSADEAGDDGGNGASMGMGVPVIVLGPTHASQVVALQPDFTFLGADKRARRSRLKPPLTPTNHLPFFPLFPLDLSLECAC